MSPQPRKFVKNSVLFMLLFASSSYAANGTVQVQMNKNDGQLEVTFKVVPAVGKIINDEAPWAVKAKHEKDKLSYEVEMYTCTKDKSQCFKDTVKDRIDWKK